MAVRLTRLRLLGPQVLRALHLVFPGQFLLKGGTSLSKGYGIIDRFSEDIDILVVPRNDHSAMTAEARLRAMVTGTAAALDLPWAESREPGRGVSASGGDVIRYSTTEDATGLNTGIRLGEVLLETGFAGGPEPSEMCEVTTLVGTALKIPSGDYEDLAPFDLRMLDPRRTLIEKCSALHHLASTWTEKDPPTDARFRTPLLRHLPAPWTPAHGRRSRRLRGVQAHRRGRGAIPHGCSGGQVISGYRLHRAPTRSRHACQRHDAVPRSPALNAMTSSVRRLTRFTGCAPL